MVVASVLGGALLVAFVILVTVLAKASGSSRRAYSGADGSGVTMFAGGSDGCDSGSSSDGGCGDGGGSDGGGGGGGD